LIDAVKHNYIQISSVGFVLADSPSNKNNGNSLQKRGIPNRITSDRTHVHTLQHHLVVITMKCQASQEQSLSPTSVVASTPNQPCSSSTATTTTNSSVLCTANVSGKEIQRKGIDLLEKSSPVSVAIVTSTSSPSLLSSSGAAAAASPARNNNNNGTAEKVTIVAKPFFVMDWLEDIDPVDLELARQMLQTAGNINSQSTPRRKFLPTRPETPLTAASSSSTLFASNNLSSRNSIVLPSLDSLFTSNDVSDTGNNQDKDEHDTSDVCRRLYPEVEEEDVSSSAASSSHLTSTHGSSIGDRSSHTSDTSTSASSDGGSSEEDSTPRTGRRKTSLGELATSPSSQGSYSTSSASASVTNANQTATTCVESSCVSVCASTSSHPPISPFRKRSIAIGNGYNAKGLAKAKKGNWESALACWENALEIRQQVLGETHPDVANTCNNIGIALGKLGRFDAAIEVLERALELRARYYGTREHVEIAATLHNIGNVLHAARDCAGAIQCFWDAKLLQEQLLGVNHIQVARSCVAIGNVYYEEHQYEDAREAYLDALQIFANASLPQTHPEVLAIQADLQDIENLCALQSTYTSGGYRPTESEHYHTYQFYPHEVGHYNMHSQGVHGE